MINTYTIPSAETIEKMVGLTPIHMFPSSVPWAVVKVGALSPIQCNSLIDYYDAIKPYNFPGCGATETTEGPRPMSPLLKMVRNFGLWANENHFHFELSHDVDTWGQWYQRDDDYQLHADASPGQTRKMTVVVMLSDARDYDGGVLELWYANSTYPIPRSRGTMVAFPSWQFHQVTRVLRGFRRTINMGFYGPPFR